MNRTRCLALLMALAMVFALSACRSANDPGTTQSPAPTQSPTQPVETAPVDTPTEAPTEEVSPSPVPTGEEVNLMVLSGPTGIGAAKLLADSDKGMTKNVYHYTIAAENSEVVAALTTGEADIAAVASNVAVNLYNKTDGGVKILALGTLGVLHIVEGSGGTAVNSVDDLAGKTIWSPGQGANPEYVLRYILSENGLDPDEDVKLVFADAAEITQKLMTGEAEVAMLPVPAATAAIMKSEGKIRAALDVTEEWDDLGTGSRLIMTAVVARTAFLEEHPEAVAAFLEEYAASIAYVNENHEEASQLIADFGIAPSAAIAKQAIPQCNLTFISGADMAPAINGYYEILWQANPAAVGGALPDDAIYYVP